jgi:hypothetical protein
VEITPYSGGSANGYWQTGGSPLAGSKVNVYALEVSAPGQIYYLNQGVSTRPVVAIDYLETVSITSGATVTLHADSRDSYELRNIGPAGQPIVVAGIPPAPAAYDGQFVQMDVLSVVKQ